MVNGLAAVADLSWPMQAGGIHGRRTSTTAAAPKDLAGSVWNLIWVSGLVGRCPAKVHRFISDRVDDVCPVSCDLLISSAVPGIKTFKSRRWDSSIPAAPTEVTSKSGFGSAWPEFWPARFALLKPAAATVTGVSARWKCIDRKPAVVGDCEIRLFALSRCLSP